MVFQLQTIYITRLVHLKIIIFRTSKVAQKDFFN